MKKAVFHFDDFDAWDQYQQELNGRGITHNSSEEQLTVEVYLIDVAYIDVVAN